MPEILAGKQGTPSQFEAPGEVRQAAFQVPVPPAPGSPAGLIESLRKNAAASPDEASADNPRGAGPTSPAEINPSTRALQENTTGINGNNLRSGSPQPAPSRISSEPTEQPAIGEVARPASWSPASMTPPSTSDIRTVAATDGNQPILTEGPRLRVSSIGPPSVTVNKTARFEIVVENLESIRAENIIVGVDFPSWVEINHSMPSTGSRETAPSGGEEPRMIWEIPIVESSAREKITIDVTPREARAFDVDLEWTFKPIRGKSIVEVTEPQLMIQMSGPAEVQFGEKALYHVTVSNPGTGIAENVVVMLPKILGGERATLGSIEPQQQKQFQVELIARSAGPMELVTTVTADNDLQQSDTREIMVRRAELDVQVEGPPMKFAGTTGTYQIRISNHGDAMARDVIAAVALPAGVEYLSGIEGIEKIEGGIRWPVGMLSPGNHRTWQITCNMAVAGDISIEAAARGAGDLAATDQMVTKVDSVADLVLSVADPKGPLPTGDQVAYEITIRNRGTRSARDVNIVMHFSEGIEPVGGEGVSSEVAPGQITFAPIARIDPGQEIVLKVNALASKSGSHRFRAQLLCEESDSHEVAEGTTRFYGDDQATRTMNASSGETSGDFQR